MKKKILILFTVITILLSNAVYADIPKFHYSFEEAFKMALENSPEYKGMNKSINDAYDYFEALDKMTPSDIHYSGSMKTFVSRQVDPQINREAAYTNYQSAILTRNNIKRNIELGLRETVIGIRKAEMASEEAKSNKKYIENQLKLLKIQLDQGMVSQSDYKNKKREIDDNIKKLDKVDKSVDMAYRQLNMMLGREDEKDIAVHLNDTEIPLENLDLKQIKKDIMNNGGDSISGFSNSLRALKDSRFLADYKYTLVQQRYDRYDIDKFTYDMRSDIEDMRDEAEEEYDVADKKYKNALARFDKDFEDMLEDIGDLYDDIIDAEREIDIEKENQSIYKIKYNAGLISKLEYDNLKDKIVFAQNKLEKTKLDLNMYYANLLIYSKLDKVVLD